MTEGNFLNKLFKNIFYLHLVSITILVIVLAIRSILSASHTHHFDTQDWYLPVLVSTAFAAIAGFAWQALTAFNPLRTMKVAFWLSPLLIGLVGFLLVSIGTTGSLVAAAIAVVSAVTQSLYWCWVQPRLEHAGQILLLSIAIPPQIATGVAFLSIITCTLYSSLLFFGIGGATATNTSWDILFIFAILLSLTWTAHIIKNTQQVAISHIKYMQLTYGLEIGTIMAFKNTFKHSIGTICIGSILVPVICVIRGSSRAISMVSKDADEFMFSCTSCYSAIASRLVAYGNRWGFVHIGLHNKGIVQSSKNIWEMFQRAGIEQLINSDLTSSFCFLSGTAGGAACALLGGSWALMSRRNYATEVSIYTFLSGYFMIRVAMSWIQAGVSAYYVAYAENPQNQKFDCTIPKFIEELQRSRV
ncbi:unnamed protein product [Coffea canephora]|uniref:Choline transporter-like protein n=2 Tax=Coffea TaxID=13442 RepID=A0A068V9F3_COFCA|nr:protein PNS1-like [Coffea arabica]CDP17390.1 unnamed protein product [Coffea canephora]